MTMTTLSSDGRFGGLLGGMLKRNRSNMLYFGILLFVVYPLQYMMYIFSSDFDRLLANVTTTVGAVGMLMGENALHMTSSTAVLVCISMFVMTLVVGLAQFSYLHSKKAVDVYHALPVRRSTLALANITAGFVTVMAPLAVNYLIVLIAGLVKWATNPHFPLIVGGLLVDLACWAVIVLAVLSIIAFVAVQVGSIFDHFLFSCELLVVFPACILLTLSLFDQLLRGYSIDRLNLSWLSYTSPVTLMAEWYTSGYDNHVRNCLVVMGVWLVVALLLIGAAMRLYRKRPSEVAESSTSNCALSKLGVLAATYIGGTFCGLVFSGISGGLEQRYAFVLWTILFSTLIFVLAQIILQRGFKGIRRAVVPGVITVGLITVFSVILATGGLGYESRLPAAADVQSVTVNYRGRYGDIPLRLAESRYAYEDETMPGVTLYRYNVKNGVDLESQQGVAAVQRLHQVASDRSLDDMMTGSRSWISSLQITYNLASGRQMTRNYDYDELSAVEAELLALENIEEFKRETHPAFLMPAETYSYFEISDALGFEQSIVEDRVGMQRLLDAIAADLLAEDVAALEHTTELAPCVIRFMPATPAEYLMLTQDAYNDGYVVVRSSYTNTLAVLHELGLDRFTGVSADAVDSLKVYYESWWRNSESPVMLIDQQDSAEFARNMSYAYSENDDLMVTVTDRGQISSILQHCFNLGCSDQDPVSVVFYDAEGNYGGAAQIQFDDLPQQIIDSFPEWVRQEKHPAYTLETVEYDSVAIIGGADGPTEIYVTE